MNKSPRVLRNGAKKGDWSRLNMKFPLRNGVCRTPGDSQPIAPPETRTQAGKSCLEAGEAHPADDGLSGWAEDVGFVEDIEHSPLVQRLQVAPAGERSRCWAGGQGQGHGMGDGGGTGPYLCITSVLSSMARVSRQHSTSEHT